MDQSETHHHCETDKSDNDCDSDCDMTEAHSLTSVEIFVLM